MQKALIVILLLVVVILTTYQCRRPREVREVFLRYDKKREVLAPVVRPGTVVHIEAMVKWINGKPCDPAQSTVTDKVTKCTIRKDATQRTPMTYKCTDRECDPEIIVDETGTVRDLANASTPSTPTNRPRPKTVNMFCEDRARTLTFDHEWGSSAVPVGERVRWLSEGEEDSPITNWTVTLAGGDAAKYCSEGMIEFNDQNDTCTLTEDAPEMMAYKVSFMSVRQCTTPAMDYIPVNK